MFICITTLAFGLVISVAEPVRSESRIEMSYRDTSLVTYVESAKRLLVQQPYMPTSLVDASAQIEQRLPEHVRASARKAARTAENRMAAYKNIPGRASATIFASYFWETFVATFDNELPSSVQPSDRKMLLSGFYESLLNEYALAWGMRQAQPTNRLRSACASYGIDDVTACLKVLFVYAFAKDTSLDLRFDDVAFVYLPQPIPDS